MSDIALRARSLETLVVLTSKLEKDSFTGWDPYDALSSPVLRFGSRTRLMRQASIQALKRSPVNLRPILGVRRTDHAMGLALAASGYTLLAHQQPEFRSRAVALARKLQAKTVPVADGLGWGYDFDVQTRWGFYASGTPNAVVTSFASHALLDVSEFGESSFRETAEAAGRFALSKLYVRRRNGGYFGYYDGSAIEIHNASALVASFLSRLQGLPDGGGAAKTALARLLDSQRVDGSWSYGEAAGLRWVDGYHTAFILQCLNQWADDPRVVEARGRGLAYYLGHLIDPDGAPRATEASRYPIDIHGAAFAVAVLSSLSASEPTAFRTASEVLTWTLDHMMRRDGRFAFQSHRRYRIGVPYVRWSDAAMVLALCSYLRAAAER